MVRRRPRPRATRIGSAPEEERGAGRTLFGLLEFVPEHHRDQLQRRKLRNPGRADQPAVAQHGYSVGDRVDLLDEMGDEDDRDPSRLEIAENLEEQRRLGRIEARRRFVEHEQASVVLERSGDRHELLDRHRIGAERPLDVDVEAEPLEPLARELARRAPGNQAEPARLTAERQVLGHRHRRHQIDFLIDGADAQRARADRGSRFRPHARRGESRRGRRTKRRS